MLAVWCCYPCCKNVRLWKRFEKKAPQRYDFMYVMSLGNVVFIKSCINETYDLSNVFLLFLTRKFISCFRRGKKPRSLPRQCRGACVLLCSKGLNGLLDNSVTMYAEVQIEYLITFLTLHVDWSSCKLDCNEWFSLWAWLKFVRMLMSDATPQPVLPGVR